MIEYGTRTAAVPPSMTIREALETRGLSQKEFAVRMGMSEKHISHMLNNKTSITPETALRLEMVFGVPASFWNSLEANYRDDLARVDEERAMCEEFAIARAFQYAKLVKHGIVQHAVTLIERVRNLRAFFEVHRLRALSDLAIPGISFRMLGDDSDAKDYMAAAWSQKVRLTARSIETKPFCVRSLNSALPKIRSLTRLEPKDFLAELPPLLASNGVAYVLYPHIPGSRMHGASFRDGKKIVLGLTGRCNSDDRFWFDLFHELGHIISEDIENGSSDEQERAADRFAADTLIPQDDYRDICALKKITRDDITAFAANIGIAPSIVVGRLQKDRKIPYNRYNDVKKKVN